MRKSFFGVNDNVRLSKANHGKEIKRKGIHSDAMFKEVFSNKKVTAYLLALVIPEFKGKDVNYVIQCINDAIDPKELEKNPLKLNIEPTESGTGTDKVIRFDILFKINSEKRMATILIDLEMQNIVKESTLKYNIFNRITYYSTRLVSNQLTSIKSNLSYNLLDKIYTIWIIGKEEQLFDDVHSVHNFSIRENDNKIQSPFDLVNIITIELGKFDKKEYELCNYLEALFNLNKDKLIEYFTESELFDMSKEWDFGEACREEGVEQGVGFVVLNMYHNGIPIDSISQMTSIPLDEVKEICYAESLVENFKR